MIYNLTVDDIQSERTDDIQLCELMIYNLTVDDI